jgi:predicted lipoprotein with Yx(FWY)xxD motif
MGAAFLGLATVAAVQGATSAAASNKVTVGVATVAKYGKILVDQQGLALYIDTKDKPPKHWACSGDCLTAWPPLVLPKGQTSIAAPKGVTGLSTIVGPSGRQVTWKGHPLYTFIKDSKGVLKGQGLGKIWFVVQPFASTTGATGGGTTSTTMGATPTTMGGPSTTGSPTTTVASSGSGPTTTSKSSWA